MNYIVIYKSFFKSLLTIASHCYIITSMNTLSENLRNLMWEFRISESELARRVGISQPVIHRIAKGLTQNPNVETLRPIVKYFSISLDQLLGDAPLPIESLRSGSYPRRKHWTAVPLLTWRQAVFWDQLSADFNPLQRANTETEVSDNAFALQVEDHSFAPIFTKGTFLIVDPNIAPQADDHLLVLIKAQDEVNIFRSLAGEKQFRLQSLSPDKNMTPTWDACVVLGVIIEARIELHSPRETETN